MTDLFTPEQRRAIKRCKRIYEPQGNAGEYAPLATNPYRGCGHACAYCYVPHVTKQPRPIFDEGPVIINEHYLGEIRADARRLWDAGVREQVMLSFLTDPYAPGAPAGVTRQVLTILRDHDLSFCTLTKGGLRAWEDRDLFRPERDAFAVTLTSVDDAFSLKWERKAATATERIEALRRFHARGIFTWVSLEPTLDADASIKVVEWTHEFVDLYKVGRANYLPMTRTMDWRGYTERVTEVLRTLNKNHYVKRDLQPFLPAGYHNPLRVPQHH